MRARSYTRRLREHRERFNLTVTDTDDEADRDADARSDRLFFPRRIVILIEGVVLNLEKLEGVLK